MSLRHVVMLTALLMICACTPREGHLPNSGQSYGSWRGVYSGLEAPQSSYPKSVIRSAEFVRANLGGSQFRLSDAINLWVSESDFRDVDLRGGFLRGLVVRHSDFAGARLDGTSLRSVRFLQTSLRRASFRNSELLFGSFNDCDLRGADFTGARLSGVTFKDSVFDSETKLPFSKAEAVRRGWREAAQ